MKVSDYLLTYLRKWETREGERKTLKQFAEYLGVSYKSFNHLWRDRRVPSQEVADQIYSVTGDQEIYDISGLDRPDYRLAFIRKNWGDFPDEEKEKVMEMLSRYQSKKRAGNDASTKTNPRPKPAYP
jgi:transcriptional regulator with XRE-family HTH domain